MFSDENDIPTAISTSSPAIRSTFASSWLNHLADEVETLSEQERPGRDVSTQSVELIPKRLARVSMLSSFADPTVAAAYVEEFFRHRGVDVSPDSQHAVDEDTRCSVSAAVEFAHISCHEKPAFVIDSGALSALGVSTVLGQMTAAAETCMKFDITIGKSHLQRIIANRHELAVIRRICTYVTPVHMDALINLQVRDEDQSFALGSGDASGTEGGRTPLGVCSNLRRKKTGGDNTNAKDLDCMRTD